MISNVQIFFIKFQPRSLFRLALAAAASDQVRNHRIEHWNDLPAELHALLNRRCLFAQK